jgi:DNA-binding winged helix-turn-helix (wHTH) protein/TolB-like protein/Flp pilus assembly protein TadD
MAAALKADTESKTLKAACRGKHLIESDIEMSFAKGSQEVLKRFAKRMAKQINHFYEFGSVRLDATNRLLYKGDTQLALQPRVIETLLVLVKNARAVVDKETLLQTVWPDVVVEEGGLKRNISILRKALGEEGELIETLPKRGYRFKAEVKEDWEESPFYVGGETNPEIVLQRRANLRITHEEEVSDSSDAHPEVAIHTQTRHNTPTARPYWRWAAAAVLFAGLGLFWTAGKLGSTATPIKSVAVLPFKNLTTHGDEHAGIGIADVLITRLSNVKDLKVRPTSAVIKVNNQEQDTLTAGQLLGVDAVLEGSIYRSGDRVRITARLLRVSDQSPVWAGQFDEKADNSLLLQNAIAQQVVGSLALNLSRNEKDALTKRYTENEDAYQLYITGRYHWSKRTGDSMVQAESYFRKAIEKDPDFALAYLGVADTLSMGLNYDEPKRAIEKAIELDGRLGEAYASLAFWKMFKAWQWSEAEAHFKQAIELNPGYGTAHQWYATLLAITGRLEEAKAEMRRALEIDPTSHNFLTDLAQMHYFSREYTEAERYCRKALEIYPGFVLAHDNLKDIYLKQSENDKAFEEEIQAARASYIPFMDTDETKQIAMLREGYRRSGYPFWWKKNIDLLSHRRADGFSYFALVRNHTLLGEKVKALDALEKAYENHEFMLPFLNVDPTYDELRTEPRFQAVMQKMNLSR